MLRELFEIPENFQVISLVQFSVTVKVNQSTLSNSMKGIRLDVMLYAVKRGLKDSQLSNRLRVWFLTLYNTSIKM